MNEIESKSPQRRGGLSRRQFLGLATATVASAPALAAHECLPNPYGPTVCVAGIRSDRLDHGFSAVGVATLQQRSQWCWAACISMVFGYYGFRVAQEDIVQRIKGAPIDQPGQGYEITAALSAGWIDSRGRAFHSQARVMDALGGRYELMGNHDIVQELAADRPLISGAAGHATVVTAMEYVHGPYGIHPVRVTVRDPWRGRGRRFLSLQEMLPFYVAAIEVWDA